MMNNKWIKLLLSSLLVLSLVGCASNSDIEPDNNQPGTSVDTSNLETLVDSLYDDIPEDKMPGMMMNTVIDKENAEYFLGTNDVKFKQAIASEAAISSIAHSVVLVELEDGSDVEAAKKEITAKIDPRKWICVESEKTIVENKGNLIVIIMSFDDTANQIAENFDKL